MVWVWLLAFAFVPVAATTAFVHIALIIEWFEALAERLHLRRRKEAKRPPVEQLAADLRRLGAYLAELEQSDNLHRAARLRAAALAYDDVLLRACRALEIEIRADTPMRPIERLETEAALAQEGLVW
jgi:hypothetical protein